MATTPTARPSHVGILSEEKAEQRAELIEMLKKAYFMELETVINYTTMSVNPDGLRAQEIKEALEKDIQEELAHAQAFARRIKTLYGTVPGSMDFRAEQASLQPPEDQTDLVQIIAGVIDAENGAIDHYNRVIEFTEDIDPVTNDMVIAILADEEEHRRLFEGFMREFERYGDGRTTA
jgi:bacterioferritin